MFIKTKSETTNKPLSSVLKTFSFFLEDIDCYVFVQGFHAKYSTS